MTEPQLRALTMCEIRFYEATVHAPRFRALLESLGWRPEPRYDAASLESLQRLAKGLRSKLRTSSLT